MLCKVVSTVFVSQLCIFQAEVTCNFRYDPERLADVLSQRKFALNLRALRIATTLGGFVTTLLRVSFGGRGISSYSLPTRLNISSLPAILIFQLCHDRYFLP